MVRLDGAAGWRGWMARLDGAAPLELIEHRVSVTMPQRGIAYQPRVQTLGIYPKDKPAF